MSRPVIVIERKIVVGDYCYIIREHGDFPDGTELAYRDHPDPKQEVCLSIAGLDDLDAIIECLQARRTEVKDYLDAKKANKG